MSANETGGLVTVFIVNFLGVLLGAAYMKRVHLETFQKGLVVALVLAILNVTLGSVLDFLAAPLRWITLGLFALVIDAIVILIASKLMKGFKVESFMPAVGLAVIIAIVNVLFDWVF